MALTSRAWAILLTLGALNGHLPFADAGTLRKIWEVDLGKAVHRNDGSPEFPVFALRFSPDGRKVAVIADVYGAKEARRSRLLLIEVDRPTASVRQFEIEWGVLENESGRTASFGWSPSGEIIYALGKVIHVSTGASCELPDRSVFIGDDLAVSAQSYPPPLYSSTRVTFFNQNCEQREKWEVSEGWLISDVSTDRRLLSVLRETNVPTESERLIVDPVGRKVLQRWHDNLGGAWAFADSGKTVCQGGSVLQSDRAPARCRDVDSGRETGQTVRNGTAPIEAATQGTRLVVSDYQRWKIPFDYEYQAAFKGRYVWDFRRGEEVASWFPESETYPDVFKPGKHITEPFRFAISPNGQFLVEGGKGTIRFYKIEP